MECLFFVAINPDGEYVDLSFWGKTLDQCLDVLTNLVQGGWQLISAKVSYGERDTIYLPIEAIDGAPLNESLQQLELELNEILTSST